MKNITRREAINLIAFMPAIISDQESSNKSEKTLNIKKFTFDQKNQSASTGEATIFFLYDDQNNIVDAELYLENEKQLTELNNIHRIKIAYFISMRYKSKSEIKEAIQKININSEAIVNIFGKQNIGTEAVIASESIITLNEQIKQILSIANTNNLRPNNSNQQEKKGKNPSKTTDKIGFGDGLEYVSASIEPADNDFNAVSDIQSTQTNNQLILTSKKHSLQDKMLFGDFEFNVEVSKTKLLIKFSPKFIRWSSDALGTSTSAALETLLPITPLKYSKVKVIEIVKDQEKKKTDIGFESYLSPGKKYMKAGDMSEYNAEANYSKKGAQFKLYSYGPGYGHLENLDTYFTAEEKVHTWLFTLLNPIIDSLSNILPLKANQVFQISQSLYNQFRSFEPLIKDSNSDFTKQLTGFIFEQIKTITALTFTGPWTIIQAFCSAYQILQLENSPRYHSYVFEYGLESINFHRFDEGIGIEVPNVYALITNPEEAKKETLSLLKILSSKGENQADIEMKNRLSNLIFVGDRLIANNCIASERPDNKYFNPLNAPSTSYFVPFEKLRESSIFSHPLPIFIVFPYYKRKFIIGYTQLRNIQLLANIEYKVKSVLYKYNPETRTYSTDIGEAKTTVSISQKETSGTGLLLLLTHAENSNFVDVVPFNSTYTETIRETGSNRLNGDSKAKIVTFSNSPANWHKYIDSLRQIEVSPPDSAVNTNNGEFLIDGFDGTGRNRNTALDPSKGELTIFGHLFTYFDWSRLKHNPRFADSTSPSTEEFEGGRTTFSSTVSRRLFF